MHEPTDSDKLQGVIRNPFVFYFPIQRVFSGSIQTLPSETIVGASLNTDAVLDRLNEPE